MKGAIPLNDVNRKALEDLIGYAFTDQRPPRRGR